MTALRLRQSRIGQARIYYRVGGSGPPLVLVHGLSGSGRWWTRNMDAFTRHFEVYVIDLIGFGKSKARGAPRFALSESAEYLSQWISQLGLPRVHLVGHSMGGFIAADLTARFPERVNRLVLVDAAALPLGRSNLKHALGLLRSLRYMPFSFLPVLVTDALRAGPRTLFSAARELLSSDISDELSAIEVPTLVLWGEYDRLVPLELGQRLCRFLPDACFSIIEGAGHNPMWDRPDAFDRSVVTFLSSPHVPTTIAARQ